MGDACISGELKLPLMRYEVSLVPEHVAKRNVKDPLYMVPTTCRRMDMRGRYIFMMRAEKTASLEC